MPAFYAHRDFAKAVKDHLPEDIQKIIDRHPSLYFTGCQGPDITFFYHVLHKNDLAPIGDEMHHLSGRQFFSFAARVMEATRQSLPGTSAGEERLSYLYGFICHYTLDMMCHGYIDAHCVSPDTPPGDFTGTERSHYKIETEFDRFLAIKNGVEPTSPGQAREIRATRHNAAVIRPFFPGFSGDTAEQTTKVRDCIMKTVLIHFALYESPSFFRKFIFFLFRMLYRFTGKIQWKQDLAMTDEADPVCEPHSRELYRRFLKGIPVAVRLISGFPDNVTDASCDSAYLFDFLSNPEDR